MGTPIVIAAAVCGTLLSAAAVSGTDGMRPRRLMKRDGMLKTTLREVFHQRLLRPPG
jgi:hypothetical protein